MRKQSTVCSTPETKTMPLCIRLKASTHVFVPIVCSAVLHSDFCGWCRVLACAPAAPVASFSRSSSRIKNLICSTILPASAKAWRPTHVWTPHSFRFWSPWLDFPARICQQYERCYKKMICSSFPEWLAFKRTRPWPRGALLPHGNTLIAAHEKIALNYVLTWLLS